jgi:crossover junction endodeoxyribonuclease RuvC
MSRFIGIDASTKCGFVALDKAGQVLKQKELIGVGSVDPHRMVTLIDEIMEHIHPTDIICIESFSFNSIGKVDQIHGLGWGIRCALHRRGFNYNLVAPMALKKYCGALGNKGPDGEKIKADKIEVAKQVMKRWGFGSGSDNVTDAFVLANISLAVHYYKSQMSDDLADNRSAVFTLFQQEVVNNIIYPPNKTKKKKKVKGA